MSSAASLWKLFRDQADEGSGIGLKLFGFIAESVFAFDRIPHLPAVPEQKPLRVQKVFGHSATELTSLLEFLTRLHLLLICRRC